PVRRVVYSGGGAAAAVRVNASQAGDTYTPGTIEVIQAGPSLEHAELGQLSADAGDGSYRFVVEACRLTRNGEVDGIVTAPLNKAAMHAGGHNFPGHTELLAHEFGVKNFSLVLSAGELYFFHLTTHVSMRQAIDDITFDRSLSVLKLAGAFARSMGKPDELIGLAGLNPHAGENRIFGDEDADVLAPAVEAARAQGLNVVGPLPGDALIPAAVKGKYNLVVV